MYYQILALVVLSEFGFSTIWYYLVLSDSCNGTIWYFVVLTNLSIGTIWYYMVLSDFGMGTNWYLVVLSDFGIYTIWYFMVLSGFKQGYRYHKLRKTFSKFYRRYYDLISKFQVGLKSLLRQGLSEPDFYGDLVYKLKKIVGSNNFSAQFIKIISHYKKIGYNINVLQQTACLVVNPIMVGNFAFLFNCTPVGRTSDSMMVPT